MTRVRFPANLAFALPAALALLAGAAAPASAQSFARRGQQDVARKAMLDGQVMPFSILKRRVDRQMGDARFVGVADPPRPGVYRFQYLDNDGVTVIWVDVDAKTGNIIGRTR